MRYLIATVLAYLTAHVLVVVVSVRLTAELEDALIHLTDDDLEMP